MESDTAFVCLIDYTARAESSQRLSVQTRRLADRGLCGEFGRTLQKANSDLGQSLPKNGVSPEMRYAMAVDLIAKSAPLRILPEERIVGAWSPPNVYWGGAMSGWTTRVPSDTWN